MKLKTLAAVAVGAAAFVIGATPEGGVGFAQAQAQAEGVRPEVGKHLKDAQALIKATKYKEALAKVRDAEGVAGRNATENATIEQMRMAAASGAGDADQVVKGFEALKAAGKIDAASQVRTMETIAGTYLRAGNSAKALEWANKYFAAGGASPAMKQVQLNAQVKSGDMATVLKDAMADLKADEAAGRMPSKDKLDLAHFAALKQKDNAAVALIEEKKLNFYPTKEMWTQVLAGLTQKKYFSDKYTLDVYRLKLVTGNISKADDYMEMAQLAAQAGYPDEGKKIVEKGIAAGVLGQGAEGARHKRLADLLGKKIADAKAASAEAEKVASESKDGTPLVSLGLATAFRGDTLKGTQLIKSAIDKGVKSTEDANLYLGLAYYNGGEIGKAQAAWKAASRGSSNNAASELARLWVIQTRGAK
ncbi:hypothetical protein J7U46_03235 [Pelomonas sp. V22]|uniref:hypothetical protein n=1 Tax=Pelomonas sp. V22 TaxID=2822139 RepID=UPI0024A8400A|nr:hypothetical protein [Pelomonas sp. V22]MDI4632054.1 hypothetical protein [Pelomonas sp. V22]